MAASMLAPGQARAYAPQRPSLAPVSHPSHAGWRPIPIPGEVSAPDDGHMLQLAIRCHPCVPVSADELEPWLEKQLDELRADAPHGTLRLSRLTQGAPDLDLENGWLIELDLPKGEPLLTGNRLADALRDMRLLGLQPTLLAPQAAWRNGRAA
jgi:hypothetical protein